MPHKHIPPATVWTLLVVLHLPSSPTISTLPRHFVDDMASSMASKTHRFSISGAEQKYVNGGTCVEECPSRGGRNDQLCVPKSRCHAVVFMERRPLCGSGDELRLRGGDESSTDEEEPEEPSRSDASESEEGPYDPDEELSPERAQFMLWRASQQGQVEDVISLVRDKKADPDVCCSAENNPMECNAVHLACRRGHIKVVEELVRLGADVNSRSKMLFTPLHCAAIGGSLETCQLLVRLGANLTAADDCGDLPIDRAVASEYEDVITFLKNEMSKNKLEHNTECWDHDVEPLALKVDRFMWDFDYVPSVLKDDQGRISEEYANVLKQIQEKRNIAKRNGEIPEDYEEIMRKLHSPSQHDQEWAARRMTELAQSGKYDDVDPETVML